MQDFHFYQNSDAHPKNHSFLQIAKIFLPLIVLAAILPLTLLAIRKPTDVRFDSQASANELSVWIEPHNATMDHSSTMEVTVKANFENEARLLPGVKVQLGISGPAALESATVNYGIPFRGEVVLGKVKIIPQKSGKVTLSISPAQIVSQTFDSPLDIHVSGATIDVR